MFSSSDATSLTFSGNRNLSVILSESLDASVYEFSFRFQTLSPSATLLLIGSGSSSDFIHVYISNGLLGASFNLGAGVIDSLSGVFVSQGLWHTVQGRLSNRTLSISVDGLPAISITSLGPQFILNAVGTIDVGSTGDQNYLTGTIQGLVLNGQPIFEAIGASDEIVVRLEIT